MVWLWKTKISWKRKVVFHGYRHIYCIHKNRWYIENIAEDVETSFGTSNYELDRPLPKGKYKKVIGWIKHKLGEKIMKKFVGLKAKTYSYLIDEGIEDKKSKRHKMS